ncbi:asparagine synthase-related protein [Paenibacillus sp. LHD-117]|uniref:asparagine synthase-related protein n=1 Tax=Paenibacillus sp. LHD-117 TaxID=3071412 RepID=UPI0027DEE4B3|nr:asparagine synthase-related protein [Paenibacillus sp. LHD-117]MDQ6422358.1 asparagine synthase-related protein [Paenibacillus sp. LHD-117]
MSAITGIFHMNHEPAALEHGLGVMKAMEKFPADDVRVWHRNHVFLGCHGKWITPESVGEANPYHDSDRRLTIAADAIIDNRDELFERLQVRHDQRNGMSDCELMLLAYEKWEEESPKYLVGDFAFLIWDERKQKLFGARDFSGSRTLYFYRNRKSFAICTLIRPLLTLPFVHHDLNENWIAEYLANPGVAEALESTYTVYKDIEQVPPGHSIAVHDNKVNINRYCRIVQGDRLKLKSNDEYVEAFLDVYQKAVSARLRTHRNVGALLSGGLDSGSVVSLAARGLNQSNKRLFTYSYIPLEDFVDWTPHNKLPDERSYIQSTVNHVGNIEDHYLDFRGRNALTEVDDWLDLLEMPYKVFGNSYWIAGIHEMAREQGVGVLLSGGRGNSTISWGAALSHYANLLKRMKWINLYREIQQHSDRVGVTEQNVWRAVAHKAYSTMRSKRRKRNHYDYPNLINPALAERTDVNRRLQKLGINPTGFATTTDVYAARRKHFEQPYSWNVNGIFGTKASLRYSLWDRDPTNDLRVIQFCLSVPEEQCVQNGMDRALIRRSTEKLLPDEVRLNQRKRGIQGADGIHRMLPVWGAFIDELRQVIHDPVMAEYVNVPVVRKAIERFQEQSRPETPFDADFCILMRSLILYRFTKKYA